MGSSITMVILPILVYQLTNSTIAMGTVMMMSILPNVIILPFSGVLVDKFNRVKIMLIADFIRMILLTFIALLIFSDFLSMGWLYVLVFILGFMNGIFYPAYAAVRAKVFSSDIRTAANSITQISQQGVRILGPAIGGGIITLFSPGFGLLIDGCTYLISFVCLMLLRNLHFKKDDTKSRGMTLKKDFVEGVAALKVHAWLWVTIIAFSFINISVGGIVRVLIPWLVNVHQGHDAYVYGLIMSASGAGAIVCGAVFGMRKQWRKRGILAYSGVLINAIALMLMVFTSSVPLLMLFMFLEGAGLMLFGLIWEISMQDLVPEEKFGRVASLDMLGSFALLPLGYLLTGWLAEVIGGTNTIIGLSAFSIAIAVLVLFHRDIRGFN